MRYGVSMLQVVRAHPEPVEGPRFRTVMVLQGSPRTVGGPIIRSSCFQNHRFSGVVER